MRTFVISDIHGAFKALKQVFEQAKIDYNNDRIICLGDVCDRLPEIRECFDELLKVKNLIYVRGNHDQWAIDYLIKNIGGSTEHWLTQGGNATQKSYKDGIPKEHYTLLMNSLPYYKDEKNRIFVHGGFNHKECIEDQDIDDLMWNRNMINIARMCEKDPTYKKQKLSIYEKVYIGHTPTINYKSEKPITYLEVTNIDTGAAYGYKLSMLNIESDELFQSDFIKELYPECF